MPEYQHQTTRDYLAARRAGDTVTASLVFAVAVARLEAGLTDGGELAELLEAAKTTIRQEP
ncbi:hypothetical protein ACFWJT_15755 [Streptomyces sp. NPDC127069]|uniref:hypothetical protein n=1 Tax=Streptomyces sp. NPDC127069 TaxID=3347128 RepID=UPI0036520750